MVQCAVTQDHRHGVGDLGIHKRQVDAHHLVVGERVPIAGKAAHPIQRRLDGLTRSVRTAGLAGRFKGVGVAGDKAGIDAGEAGPGIPHRWYCLPVAGDGHVRVHFVIQKEVV